MDQPGFFRLTFREGSPGRNPLARLVWRGQLRPAQTGMLVAATVFIVGVTFLGKTHLAARSELLLYILLRWGLAEFFWIWMSADHMFSTVMSWKKRRAFDDLRLSSLTPLEIAAGFLGPALAFLLIGNTIHCLADVLIPYGRGVAWWSAATLFGNHVEDVGVWRIALTVGFWLSALGTTTVATVWSFRVALASEPRRVHSRWFETLLRAGLTLGALNLLSLLGGALLASAGVIVARALGAPMERYDAAFLGSALALGLLFSGALKLWILSAREWTSAVGEVKKLDEAEPTDQKDPI